ncbi:MAG: nucleotide exchange factor GrpE [Spirochaetota bacterium]
MKDLKNLLGGSLSERAIEELTFVKTALQEKNEQLDEKDRAITRLAGRIRELEEKLREAEASLASMAGQRERQETRLKQEGCMTLIEDLVHLLSRYERRCGAGGRPAGHGEEHRRDGGRYGMIPGERVLALLAQGYGLEVIDGPVESVDPAIHHVVEVSPAGGEDPAASGEQVIPLARGYRIGERVIRPLQLKVLRGGRDTGVSGAGEGNGKENPSRLVLVHNTLPQEGPGGAA